MFIRSGMSPIKIGSNWFITPKPTSHNFFQISERIQGIQRTYSIRPNFFLNANKVLKSSSEKYWLNESAFVTDEYRKHGDKYRHIDDSSTKFKIFAKYDSLYICSNLNESERDYYYQMLLKFGGQLTSRPNRARLILCNTTDCKFNTDLNKIFKNRRRPPTISTDWILGLYSV